MKIAIDITEAVNGWRVDILQDDIRPWRENCETLAEAIAEVKIFLDGKSVNSRF